MNCLHFYCIFLRNASRPVYTLNLIKSRFFSSDTFLTWKCLYRPDFLMRERIILTLARPSVRSHGPVLVSFWLSWSVPFTVISCLPLFTYFLTHSRVSFMPGIYITWQFSVGVDWLRSLNTQTVHIRACSLHCVWFYPDDSILIVQLKWFKINISLNYHVTLLICFGDNLQYLCSVVVVILLYHFLQKLWSRSSLSYHAYLRVHSRRHFQWHIDYRTNLWLCHWLIQHHTPTGTAGIWSSVTSRHMSSVFRHAGHGRY